MKSFNVICGLPRSGSTLLCNILNQNPRFHASSTSVVPTMVSGLSQLWSNALELKPFIREFPQQTKEQMDATLRACIESWYKDKGEVIFDKSRGWPYHSLLLKQIYPNSKIIVTLRDLRSVFGSIEKRHRENAILDPAEGPMMKTIFNRADTMFSANGIIGTAIEGIYELMRRQPGGVILVRYEMLTSQPDKVLSRLYQEMEEPVFSHDLDNIKNVSMEADELYLGKFPHDGSGRLEARPEEWQKYVPQDIAKMIMGRFSEYNHAFGYEENIGTLL